MIVYRNWFCVPSICEAQFCLCIEIFAGISSAITSLLLAHTWTMILHILMAYNMLLPRISATDQSVVSCHFSVRPRISSRLTASPGFLPFISVTCSFFAAVDNRPFRILSSIILLSQFLRRFALITCSTKSLLKEKISRKTRFPFS